MRIVIPSDITTEPERAAYKRGWRDRSAKAGKIGGSVSSPAKADAARANGAKGGRPRKEKPK
jgi:hypothetical protein